MTDFKLIGEGTFGCVYTPSIDCKTRETNDALVSKFLLPIQYNEIEYKCSKIIRKYKNFRYYFVPVLKYCKMKRQNIPKSIIDTCHVMKKSKNIVGKKKDDEEYIHVTSEYIPHDYLFDIMINEKHQNKVHPFFRQLYHFLNHLLDGIKILNNLKICHLDMHLKNIIINRKTNLPLILDFGISIIIPNLINKNKLNLAEARECFSFDAIGNYRYPPEINIINFCILELHENDILTKESIDSVVSLANTHNPLLKLLPYAYRRQRDKQSKLFGLKYAGMTSKEVITDLVKYWDTWDMYSVCSELILIILASQIQDRMMDKTLELLLRQIHCLPTKRYGAIRTKEMLLKIINIASNTQTVSYLEATLAINIPRFQGTVSNTIKKIDMKI